MLLQWWRLPCLIAIWHEKLVRAWRLSCLPEERSFLDRVLEANESLRGLRLFHHFHRIVHGGDGLCDALVLHVVVVGFVLAQLIRFRLGSLGSFNLCCETGNILPEGRDLHLEAGDLVCEPLDVD